MVRLVRVAVAAIVAVTVVGATGVGVPGSTAEAAVPVATCYSAAPRTGSAAVSFGNATGTIPASALRGRYGHAAGWGDANGDGLPDLFLGTYAAYPPLMGNPSWTDPGYDYAPDQLLINTDTGFRVDTSFPAMRGWTSGVVFTDLDRDGDDDLVVSRFAETAFARTTAGNTELLRNDAGRFVRTSSFPAGPGGRLGGRSVGVLDYDADGFLDLFLTQDRYSGAASRLLRNPGALTRAWTDVTAAVGLPLDVEGFSATTSDLTGDGRADLYVAGSNRLFVRSATGRFVEATANVPPGPPPLRIGEDGTVHDFSTGASSTDLNGDGRTDLLMGAHFTSVETQNATVPPVRLLINRGNDAAGLPRFSEETAAAGLPTAVRSKSATVHAADVDNDGNLDIVAGVSTGAVLSTAVPTVFRGTGRRMAAGVPTFTSPADIAAVRGYQTPNAAMAWVATPWADYNRDGRLDLFGDYFFTYSGVRLLANATTTGNWLGVSLNSKVFTAPGTRITVFSAGGLGIASQRLGRRTVTATDGYVSAVPAEARFGLGSTPRTAVDIRITPPPGSPTRTVDLRNVGINRLLRVGGSCRWS